MDGCVGGREIEEGLINVRRRVMAAGEGELMDGRLDR